MSGYIGTKAVLLSTTAASVTGNADIGGNLTVDTSTLFVDSTNNRVGIGTSSPSAKTHSQVNTFTDADKIAFKGYNNQAVGVYANFQNATTGTGFADGFRVGLDDSENAQLMNGENTAMTFSTNGTERMRIDASGNLLVGKTTFGYGNAGVDTGINGRLAAGLSGGQVWDLNRIDVNGTVINFRRAGTFVGSINVSGSSTSYVTSSDYRLKENVVPLAGAADRLAQIPVHRFNFIADPDKTVDGFLAHEVQAVVPEAVHGAKDAVDADGNPDYQGIDQSKLVPLLTAALQEALNEIAALKDRVAALEAAE